MRPTALLLASDQKAATFSGVCTCTRMKHTRHRVFEPLGPLACSPQRCPAVTRPKPRRTASHLPQQAKRPPAIEADEPAPAAPRTRQPTARRTRRIRRDTPPLRHNTVPMAHNHHNPSSHPHSQHYQKSRSRSKSKSEVGIRLTLTRTRGKTAIRIRMRDGRGLLGWNRSWSLRRRCRMGRVDRMYRHNV